MVRLLNTLGTGKQESLVCTGIRLDERSCYMVLRGEKLRPSDPRTRPDHWPLILFEQCEGHFKGAFSLSPHPLSQTLQMSSFKLEGSSYRLNITEIVVAVHRQLDHTGAFAFNHTGNSSR